MLDSPCHHCEDRSRGCHSVCERYAEFQRKNEEIKNARKEYKNLKNYEIKSIRKRVDKR